VKSGLQGSLKSSAVVPLTLVLLLGAMACRRQAVPDPLPSARRYLDLAESGQIDAAYAMLSEDVRRRCDRTCFVRLLLSQRLELVQARAQVRAGEARVRMQAQVTLPDGTRLRMAQAEPGSPYLFDEDPLDFYPQDTPERTLRSFMRAVEAKRYEALLRFVPQALEEQYSVEILQKRFEGPGRATVLAQLEAIRKHQGEPFAFDKEGRSARLPVGDGKEARLVLEDGRWRVVQLE
jgi:hypothetical protein